MPAPSLSWNSASLVAMPPSAPQGCPVAPCHPDGHVPGDVLDADHLGRRERSADAGRVVLEDAHARMPVGPDVGRVRVAEGVQAVVGVEVGGARTDAAPLVPAGQGHRRRDGVGRLGHRHLLEDRRHDQRREVVVAERTGPARGGHRLADPVERTPAEVVGDPAGPSGRRRRRWTQGSATDRPEGQDDDGRQGHRNDDADVVRHVGWCSLRIGRGLPSPGRAGAGPGGRRGGARLRVTSRAHGAVATTGAAAAGRGSPRAAAPSQLFRLRKG